jgi:ATP-dependent helicase/nuclease subunit A
MIQHDDATQAQVKAARPHFSTWLSANAGSGKTRVLTDRVARLLLAQVPPERILCLTYTKAAAAEMQNRLFKRLGEWAMLDDTTLRDALRELGEEGVIDTEALRKARTLFAAAIHSVQPFCAASHWRRMSVRNSQRWKNARLICCVKRSSRTWLAVMTPQ